MSLATPRWATPDRPVPSTHTDRPSASPDWRTRYWRRRTHPAGREDEHMAVGELLFELAGEALLDFVEAGE